MFKKISKALETFFVCLSLFAFTACSDLIEAGGKQDEVQYGSITVGQRDGVGNSRAIDYSQLTSASIKVYYFAGQKINTVGPVEATVNSTTGAASGTVEKIPVGKNRVIEVTSNITGATLYCLVDEIKLGDNGAISVNWDSTALGSVYYNLMLDGTDVSSYGTTEKSAITAMIPTNVHASLVNVEQIASDYKNSTSSTSYILDYGTVKISATGCSGYSYQITDIATQKQSISSSSYSQELKTTPGTWKLWIYDSTGAKVETKTLAVAEDAVTTVTSTYKEGVVDFSDKTIIFVKASSAPKIWAWEDSGAELSKLAGATWENQPTMSEATTDYMASPSGWYMIDYTKYVTGKVIKFMLNSGSEITGKAGTFWYDGSSCSSINPSPVSTEGEVVVSVENPAVPLPPTVSINYKEGEDVSLSGSITFTVTSENTDLTSGTYTIGTKTGTLSVGTTTVKLSAAGITDEGEFAVSASVTNAKGNDSLSVKLNAADLTSSTPDRLGAYYTKKATSFSIWSPDSSNVTVEVTPVGGTTTSYTCEKGFTVNGDYPDTNNIYGVTVSGDLALAEYQFKIGGVAVRDPYGKMIKYEDADAKTNVIKASYSESNCTVTSYAGSSVNIVVDVDSILPSSGSWATRPTLESRAKSVVYEIHVGDFTSSSTWNGTESYRGKFPGLTESGTTYTSGSTTVKTGLDHLKELGVTHVQIMPMYDFATKYNETFGEYYNWGYDPVNYNVPEERYSVTPSDYENRIKEVKDMVNILHQNGIRVIMDVVYNHTFDGEMFNKISSKYYTATDLSGCGNSIDVTNSMVSRMIRDSLEYWLETYNLDGFRFDLMGIYSNSAIGEWGKYLNQKYSDRTLLLYGEPYQGNNTYNASYAYASSVPNLEYAGIGGFAHKFRETLKGGSDDGVMGYIFNSTSKDGDGTVWNTQVGLRGSMTSIGSDTEGVWTRYFTKSPYQAVNYLAAHDNLCLYDKIVRSGITTSNSAYQQAIVKFGHGIITLSQGVGFIHGGDDFLRTKSGNKWSDYVIDTRTAKENSYMFGQGMNAIDWSRKATYNDTFKYHKDLIEFKKNHNGFWNGSASTSASGMVIYYTVKDSDGTTLTCVLNPGSNITYSGSGNQIFNKKGIITSSDSDYSSKVCEGTGVTIFAQ